MKMLYTLPAKEGGREVEVDVRERTRDESCLIKVEVIPNRPEYRWVGQSALRAIVPPPPPPAPMQMELL